MGKRYIKLDRPMTPRIVQQQQLSLESAAVGAKGKRAKLTRPAGCRTVFVKNLPYECEESDVTESFMVCGKIAKVRRKCKSGVNAVMIE
jgi:RNA recognition motif-containing protein